MKTNLTIGAVWEDRQDGSRWELLAVKDGRVQIAPVAGGEYRIMGEKSLRSNYKLVALKAAEVKAQAEAEDNNPAHAAVKAQASEVCSYEKEGRCAATNRECEDYHRGKCLRAKTAATATQAPAAGDHKERAPKGRVMLSDGTIIPGAHFITNVCGKTREDTYKVDSPIRWLLKPAGQALLADKGAGIVYGQPVTSK